MAGRLRLRLERALDKRILRRWTRLARAAPKLDLARLRALRGRAGQLRDRLDRVLRTAETRLAPPPLGGDAMDRPPGTDWAWRPDAWRLRLAPPGGIAATRCTPMGEAAALFHNCTHPELGFRQIRNTRATDAAPFGLQLDVFAFDGSFLSVVLDLPDSAARGLGRRHIVQLNAVVETERPVALVARLNVKHGPNTEQVPRSMPLDGARGIAEFDLAYTGLDDRRVERLWIDLLFEHPGMNRITLADVTLTRRPRTEL